MMSGVQLRLILAPAARRELEWLWALRRAQNIYKNNNIHSISIIITLKGIETM